MAERPLAPDQIIVRAALRKLRGLFREPEKQVPKNQEPLAPINPLAEPKSVQEIEVIRPAGIRVDINATFRSQSGPNNSEVTIEMAASGLNPDEAELMAKIGGMLFNADPLKRAVEAEKRAERLERDQRKRETIERLLNAGLNESDQFFNSYILNAERVPELTGKELVNYLSQLKPQEPKESQGI